MKYKKEFFRYSVRNAVLKELGYLSYNDYLKSEDWRNIRDSILLQHKNCILCEKKSQVPHHVKYDVSAMLGLRMHVLAALCHACHSSIEFDNGNKLGVAEANTKLFRLARLNPTGLAWLKIYHIELGKEKRNGKREKSKKVMREIMKAQKPWEKYKNNK